MSTSTTSAASTLSPDLKVRSMVRPVLRLRTLTRLKAWPLPGLTISFSTIEYGSPSMQNAQAGLEFVGDVAGHFFSAAEAAQWRPCKRGAYDNGITPEPPADGPGVAPTWQHELAQAVTDPLNCCRLLELDPEPVARRARRGRSFPPAGAARLRARACAAATRPIRCCGRCCRGGRAGRARRIRLRSARRRRAAARAGAAAEVSRPRAADHHRRLRRPLPLLLPARVSLRRTHGSGGRWQAALQAIAADPSIEEVILSGGDPLTLSDARLQQLTDALRAHPAYTPAAAAHPHAGGAARARRCGLLRWLRVAAVADA